MYLLSNSLRLQVWFFFLKQEINQFLLKLFWEELFHRFVCSCRRLNQCSIWSSRFNTGLWLSYFSFWYIDLTLTFSPTISWNNRPGWAIRTSRGLPVFIDFSLFFLWFWFLLLSEFILDRLFFELKPLVKREYLTDNFRDRHLNLIFPITTLYFNFINLWGILPEFQIILHLICPEDTRMCLPCRVQGIVHWQDSCQ